MLRGSGGNFQSIDRIGLPANPGVTNLEAVPLNQQGQFNFEAATGEEGYARWLAGRRVAAQELARRLNLPLNRPVEVWLFGGIRLRGTLRLEHEVLLIDEEQVRHLPLKVGAVTFTLRELESCVRLEENGSLPTAH